MYETILITLDTTPTDRDIIEHIKLLAKKMDSRVILLHVLDGWAARRFGPDAVSEEVDQDTAYMARIKAEFESEGIAAETRFAYGDPADEIVKWVENHHCDLIAMSTHGHSGLADLVLGWTASRVQHQVDVPVLMLKAKREPRVAEAPSQSPESVKAKAE